MSTTTYSPNISVGNVQLNNVYSSTDLISQAASLPLCTTPAGTNAMQGAVSLVSNAPTYGTAGFFPGPTGNYMNFNPTTAVFDLATNNMFVECWFYSPGAGGGGLGNLQQVLAGGGPTINTDQLWGIYFYFTPNNSINFYVCNNAAGSTTATLSVTLNYSTWYHAAVSWIASTKSMYVFLNGQTPGTNTLSGTVHGYSTSYGLYVGADFNRNTCNGFVRDVRIIQGGTPPTSAFTPDTASAPFSTTAVPYGITGGTNIFTFLNQWASSNNAAAITQWIQKTINKIAQPTTQAIAGTGVTFPRAALTSVNSTITDGTYLVFSSSDLAGPAVPNSWQAFDKVTTGTAAYWQSAQNYSAAGAYTGTASLGGVSGEWLMIGLPYRVSLTSYTLYRRTDITTQMAVSWTILGSNDRVTYTSVNTQTAQSWTSPLSLTFSVTGSAAYQYYAIVIQTVASTAGTSTTSILEWSLVGDYNTTVTNFSNPFWSSNTSSYNYTQIAIPNNAGGTGGNGGWSGCVTIPDGRIIVAPQIPTITSMGIFNPATNAFTTIPASAGTNYTFAGVSLAPDGRVIFCPFRTTSIGIYNPVTNVFSTLSGGLTANPGHGGTCQLPNGKTLFAPYDNGLIGIFDPVTSTYRTANTFTSYTTDGLNGTVPLPDGRVILCPCVSGYALIYNYVTNTYTTFTHPSLGGNQFFGGALLPDGTVAFAPNSVKHIGIFNPNTNSFTTIPISSSGYIGGGKLLPNGLLMHPPYNTTVYGLYNYVTKSYLTGPATGSAGAGNCQSAGLAFDGRVICPPYVNASNMGIYTGMTTPAPPEYVLHPLINRSG